MTEPERQITLETEIADAVKRFEAESPSKVIDIRIDRYDEVEFCIGSTVEFTKS